MSGDDNPFSNWSKLVHRRVYSLDGKKLGVLKKVLSDYMIIMTGFIILDKYIIPRSLAESVSQKGIRLKITAYQARSTYSLAKMKQLITSFHLLSEEAITYRQFYDRFETLRYNTTRNTLAAGIAFVSGILFLLSGYKANLAIYSLIQNELILYTAKQFLTFVLVPVGLLALLGQLGGITVLVGAGLFAVNRVNVGKFLVAVGTGQGIFTIFLRITYGLWTGLGSPLDNNYITWLTSSASGLGVLFAVISQTISKGKNRSIYLKILRFILRKPEE